jgi:hypothetical protein
MLAEKYLLLLETLRKSLPEWSQAHLDGAPKVVNTSPHIFPSSFEFHSPARSLMGD